MKNYGQITDDYDVINKKYADDLDATSVHKTGDETIEGTKTFTSNITMGGKTVATLDQIPTSVNGLSGGTLTSPLTLTGGDSATASKIILTSSGQITNEASGTLLGLDGGVCMVGYQSYNLRIRGSESRPTYNGLDMALKSDIPTISTATQSDNGLMSSSDKTKLDGIASGATANTGTITGITMNGTSKGTSGVVNLGTVLTAHQDISGLAKSDASNLTTSNISSWKSKLSLNNVQNLKIVTGDTYVSSNNQDISTGLSTVSGFVAILHEEVGTSTNLGITLYWRTKSGGTVNVTPRNTGNGAYLTNHTFHWWAIGT